MIKQNVIKTLFTAGLVSLTVASVNADAPSTGFYVGAALGGSAMTGTSNLFINRDVAANPLPQNFNTSISDKNVAGDIFIGFGKRINCAWLAIEALASLSSLNSKSTLDLTELNSGQTLTLKTTNSWGGAINLGYFINAMTKLYLKLGIESRSIRNSFNQPDNTSPVLSLNKSNRSTAFVPGLGIETDLTPRFSVRGEYRVALHSKKTSTVSGTTPIETTITTKPTIHYFMLGLTFRI